MFSLFLFVWMANNASSDLVYGFNTQKYQLLSDQIRPGQTLASILMDHGLTWPDINDTVSRSTHCFDVRELRRGNRYSLLARNGNPRFFIYERNRLDYVVLDLTGSRLAWTGRKPVNLSQRLIAGEISGSLYNALPHPRLVKDLVAAFEHRIDFHHLQQGDHFKLVYQERQLKGETLEPGQVLAAWFHHGGQNYHAFYVPAEDDWFDEQGHAARTGFLRAPIRGGVVSSPYSRRRFHPVLKRYKSHLGTDFAAPTGTPIQAIGDGIVAKVERNRYNGLYVNIKHNTTYTTQYLHMSRFVKGIKAGQRIKQGQIIGYVGSTGLASGPHVCLRFRVNGTQVDFTRQSLPMTTRQVHDLEAFFTLSRKLKAKLHQKS